MQISVVNRTRGKVSDEELLRVIRAINRQLEGDFAPHWGMGGALRLEGAVGKRIDTRRLAELRGDAVIYVRDTMRMGDEDGFHQGNAAGIPYGVVYLDVSKALDENWTVTLSHEVIELVADPQVNLFAAGPHPKTGRMVLFWYEACDAVQTETYRIDGVDVSNFVLPLYFTIGHETGGRNEFLGRVYGGKCLKSFGVNPGGYVGYMNPRNGHQSVYEADELAATRRTIKSKAKHGRRSVRYQAVKSRARRA